MGCLIELLFEFVIELVGTIYVELMTLIVPEHKFDKRLRKKIKNGITVFAVLLFICALIGFGLYTSPNGTTKTVGTYMLFIPLITIGVQILAGIIYQIIKAMRSR